MGDLVSGTNNSHRGKADLVALSDEAITALADAIAAASGGGGGARENTELTILPSLARTANTTSGEQTNEFGSSLFLMVNVSAPASGFELTSVRLQVKDPASGSFATIWTAGAGITAAGLYTYLFAPGADALAAGFTEVLAVPFVARTFRVQVTRLDATAVTYSVGAILGV